MIYMWPQYTTNLKASTWKNWGSSTHNKITKLYIAALFNVNLPEKLRFIVGLLDIENRY